ncbi:hypothetical protein Lser_V15G23599 [Lactuca serriola]
MVRIANAMGSLSMDESPELSEAYFNYRLDDISLKEASIGVGTPIQRGLGRISLLKWSPTRDYFFATKFDGTFYLWETNTWTSKLWSSTSGFFTI